MADSFVSAEEPQKDNSEVDRDEYGRYKIPPFTDPEGKPIPHTRVTTFCKTVVDTYALTQWEKRMVAKGVALKQELYALAAATPLDDKKTLDRLTDDAKSAAGAGSAASLGTALHSFTEQVDRGEDPEVPSQWKKDIEAYKDLVQSAGIEIPEWGIERRIVVSRFTIAGTLDRLVKLHKDLNVKVNGEDFHLPAGTWVIGDVKTGKTLKYSWQEISIQLATYANADAMWNGSEQQFEDLPDVNKDIALVIHLPVGKGKASLHGVDIASGWEAAALCSKVRNWRKNRNLASEIPVTVSWEDQIRAATSRRDLSKIWEKASRAGEWTTDLENLGQDRLKEIS